MEEKNNPLRIYLISIVIFIGFSFFSCTEQVEKDLTGIWVVDEMYINGEDVKRAFLYNGFDINKDHTCSIPIIEVADMHTAKEFGKWSFSKKDGKVYFTIESPNELFNGTYLIKSIGKVPGGRNEGEYYFRMLLLNDNTEIYCSKVNWAVPYEALKPNPY